jgi:hypothetical protein
MAEYTIIKNKIEEAEKEMGTFVKNGWEPISITAPTSSYLIVLMKKASENPSESRPR